jgi:hypothetical protein
VQPRGSVNPIGVLMIIGLVCATYWAIIFGPAYLDNMSLKEAADVGIGASKDYHDDGVVQQMLARINHGLDPIGSHTEVAEDGTETVLPGLNLAPENIVVERNENTRRIRISIDYSRDVRMKPTQSIRTLQFHVEKEGPIPQ